MYKQIKKLVKQFIRGGYMSQEAVKVKGKRGRPAGSKNKPKATQPETTTPADSAAE